MPIQSPYYQLSREEGAWIIELRLAHDVDTSAFNEITRDLIDHWPIEQGHRVLVDLSQSQYSGSVLLGLLMNIRQRTRAGQGEIAVSGASARLAQVLRTAHLDRLIPIFTTRKQALQSM